LPLLDCVNKINVPEYGSDRDYDRTFDSGERITKRSNKKYMVSRKISYDKIYTSKPAYSGPVRETVKNIKVERTIPPSPVNATTPVKAPPRVKAPSPVIIAPVTPPNVPDGLSVSKKVKIIARSAEVEEEIVIIEPSAEVASMPPPAIDIKPPSIPPPIASSTDTQDIVVESPTPVVSRRLYVKARYVPHVNDIFRSVKFKAVRA